MTTLPARVKAWPTISSSICLFLVMITMNNAAMVNAGSPPTYLVVYDHQVTAPGANQTALIVVQPPGTGVYQPLPYGTISVIDNTIREGLDSSSSKLGEIQGQLIIETNSFYISTILLFDTPSYSGSIAAQGVASLLTASGELVITGGTGDFRFAKGYIDLAPTSVNGPELAVFQLTLFIKYDY